MRFRIALLFLLTVPAFLAHGAPEFQFKERKLGDGQHSVCKGSSEIADAQELFRGLSETTLSIPATSCDVVFDSIAEVPLARPVHFLLWRGNLIRVVVKFEQLTWREVAQLRSTLVDLYGRPSTQRNMSLGLTTDTWRRGNSQLQLEGTADWPKSMGVYLTDLPGWTEYSRAAEAARKAIEKGDRARRKSDVTN